MPYSFYQYTCDNETQFEDFPDLNMYFSEKNNSNNFTFTKEDLFKNIGNKYFFLIVFQVTQMNIYYWRLGQLFFRKYPIFLSYDKNNSTFLYYPINKNKKDDGGDTDTTDNKDNTDYSDNTDNTDEHDSDKGKENDKNEGNTGLVVSLSIIIPLVVIAVVIFIVYHYKKRNRKGDDELLNNKTETDCNKSYPIIDN